MFKLLLAAAAVAAAQAIVCPPNACASVNCATVTEANCLGEVVQGGGFCGCCDSCVSVIAEGEKCLPNLGLLGVPPTSKCGAGLHCDVTSLTCKARSLRAAQTCAERLHEIQTANNNGLPLLGQFIPECEADGTYSAKQCHGSVCYCADSTGANIGHYAASIGEAQNMNCACARDQDNYAHTGLIGKLFHCMNNGNYERYACQGSVCFCADSQGNMKPGSVTVNIGNLGALHC